MKNLNFSRRQRRTAIIPSMTAVVCLTLSGCQGVTGPGATLAADPNDPCQQQRTDFAGSKTYFQDKIITGAAVGAAVGAGLGALTGLIAGGNTKSALTGGLIGGAAGGIAGAGTAYYNTLSERAADQDEVAADINRDLAREADQIDHTLATFARLRSCRFGVAKDLKSAVKRHELDRTTALAQIAYQRTRFDEEIQVAHDMGLAMAHRGEQFQEAANDLRAPPPRPQTAVAPKPASRSAVAQVNRAATVSIPEKRASFDQTVASAQTASKTAFDLDSGGTLSWLRFLGFDA
jgi:outer membrane lipoprotein SlyB